MVYNRPRESVELALQLLYYFLLSFILLTILTAGIDRRNASLRCFVRRCCWCLVAAAALYFVAPVHRWRTGQIIAHFMSEHSLDYVLLLRCSFAVVVSILYGRIFFLMLQRQAVEVENERLKTENLSTRYNMLVNQINPHFFFNSLNSLSMLVREREERKALVYIDQLSYTFRYILQNGQNTTSTLAEELRFAEAYGYLFKIRYADKLFFDVEIDRSLADRTLPSLTLQPLIDNAVKHNMITRSHPFRISIRTEGEQLRGLQSENPPAGAGTLDRHRARESAQPLAAHHGTADRGGRNRRAVYRASAAAKTRCTQTIPTMKALIIEDETAAAVNLQAILREIAPDVEVLATIETVEESVAWLREREQPTCCSWTSIWPTASRSAFSTVWR